MTTRKESWKTTRTQNRTLLLANKQGANNGNKLWRVSKGKSRWNFSGFQYASSSTNIQGVKESRMGR